MGFQEQLHPLLNQQPLAFGVCFSKAGVHCAPPDVTTGLVELSPRERPQLASVRGLARGCSGSVLETAGGEHASLFFQTQQSPALLLRCGTRLRRVGFSEPKPARSPNSPACAGP